MAGDLAFSGVAGQTGGSMACNYRNVSLLGCGVLALMVAAPSVSLAGGFAVREQSSYGQGASYAGIAAGGSLSSMFWNPATMTQVPGLQSEIVAATVFPYSVNSPHTGSTLLALGGTGNVGDTTLVPSGYTSWQINNSLWLGVSLNAPFGLSEHFPDAWAGRNYADGASLRTYNATPSIAYRINDWISVGFGVQIEYAHASLSTGLPTGLGNVLNVTGNGWGYGVTAGVTVKPTPVTTIGLGWRSAINQKIDGSMALPAGAIFNPPFSTPGGVNTTIDLPDVVSLGLRQKINPQLTLLGTVEWSNWSRIGTSNVNQSNGSPATVLAGLGGGAVTLPFQYRDGWFFSVGAEYQWNEQLTLRGGVGFERSPVSDQVRTPIVPDNDRTWLSVGLSYQLTKAAAIDFAYSHLFVKNTSVNISATSGNPWFDGVTYIGGVDSHIDIVSLALKYRWK
ncbi:MAG TPA: OmpP1/FadL family transporter [Pseudolabrys sp.]|nr:OmpP1/FadL family transporter [Pseudolabrys sp.]